MNAAPWFIAKETFTPGLGEAWEKYIEWSGLTQLDEVVSLDPMLCPSVLPGIKPSYWPHIVNEDFLLDYFVDLEFLLEQVAGITDRNLLRVHLNPLAPVVAAIEGFEFLGYDLVDVQGSASALTNCGGFPSVFEGRELSSKGLLASHDRAIEVQAALRKQYPSEVHADCHVWAIHRALGG